MKPALSAALCVLCIFVPALASPDQKSATTEIVSLNQTGNEDTLQYPAKVLSKNRFVFSAISNGVKITTIAGGGTPFTGRSCRMAEGSWVRPAGRAFRVLRAWSPSRRGRKCRLRSGREHPRCSKDI